MSDKSIDKLDEEEVALDETLALDSVKTKGRAADMNAVMQLMQAMPEADFNKFVETNVCFFHVTLSWYHSTKRLI